jgi:hypothetical protein
VLTKLRLMGVMHERSDSSDYCQEHCCS